MKHEWTRFREPDTGCGECSSQERMVQCRRCGFVRCETHRQLEGCVDLSEFTVIRNPELE